jgi:hypothetical protein
MTSNNASAAVAAKIDAQGIWRAAYAALLTSKAVRDDANIDYRSKHAASAKACSQALAQRVTAVSMAKYNLDTFGKGNGVLTTPTMIGLHALAGKVLRMPSTKDDAGNADKSISSVTLQGKITKLVQGKDGIGIGIDAVRAIIAAGSTQQGTAATIIDTLDKRVAALAAAEQADAEQAAAEQAADALAKTDQLADALKSALARVKSGDTLSKGSSKALDAIMSALAARVDADATVALVPVADAA